MELGREEGGGAQLKFSLVFPHFEDGEKGWN